MTASAAEVARAVAAISSQPRSAPGHHHIVVPGECRAEHWRQDALPGPGQFDLPIVAHLGAGAIGCDRPATDTLQLAAGPPSRICIGSIRVASMSKVIS
jgi:hypothetical protein